MDRKRRNQELLSFLRSVRDRAAKQKNVLYGPVIAIPPAIFLAYVGTDMDLGLAILLSIAIAIGTWLLLVVIFSLGKQRPTISKSHAAFASTLMLLILFAYSAFNSARVIRNQKVAIADLQAKIDFQAILIAPINSTPTIETLEEEINNVIRSYFELLSNNDIDTAWSTYLTGDMQQGVVDLSTRESYELFWEQREIKIEEFLSFDCNSDDTECIVILEVFYYVDDSPKGYIDTIWLVMSEEQQRWLIDRFTEEEVS